MIDAAARIIAGRLGSAAAWPMAVRAQQSVVHGRSEFTSSASILA
jgi:hypothetical protein